MLNQKQTRKRTGATVDTIKQRLVYDPNTGQFKWLSRRLPKDPGFINGKDRYRYIQLNGKNYLAHRLAFVLMLGRWPIGEVDHINCDRSDNRWNNLREGSRHDNMRNVGKKASNRSGFKGVARAPSKSERWRAQIVVDRKAIHLGCFSTREEAFDAYKKAAQIYHGEFANTGETA